LAIYQYKFSTVIWNNPHFKRSFNFLNNVKGHFKYCAISKTLN